MIVNARQSTDGITTFHNRYEATTKPTTEQLEKALSFLKAHPEYLPTKQLRETEKIPETTP